MISLCCSIPDPPYGHAQNFRPEPELGNRVYAFNPTTGDVKVLADRFVKPNGIVFSPDYKTVYVTDTGDKDVSSDVENNSSPCFSFWPCYLAVCRMMVVYMGFCSLADDKTAPCCAQGTLWEPSLGAACVTSLREWMHVRQDAISQQNLCTEHLMLGCPSWEHPYVLLLSQEKTAPRNQTIYAFDVVQQDSSSLPSLQNRRVFVTVESEQPDGIKVDSRGNGEMLAAATESYLAPVLRSVQHGCWQLLSIPAVSHTPVCSC